MRGYQLVEMNEPEKVENTPCVLAITNQMRSNGEVMGDTEVVDMILILQVKSSCLWTK